MQTLIDKFQLVMNALEEKHGQITLFGLFLREDALEKWDVVIAASWLNPNSLESYSLVNTEIQKFIKNGNLIKLSRIVILSMDNPVIKLLQNTCIVEKGQVQLSNTQILSDALAFNIKAAYLLKCIKN